MAVTRDDVVHTAIQLLQEVGLDGLTLRRLATELGISAPTLYWHVKDKRELLDLMAETMVADERAKQPPFPDDLPWHEQIAEGFRRQFQVLIAYRDGPRVVAGNRPTERAMPQVEHFLKIWVDAGFEPSEALETVLAMGDFITGTALEHQAEMERRNTEAPEARADLWERMQDYPILHAAATGFVQGNRRPATKHPGFERGLSVFIAGLKVRHAELMAERQKTDR